MTIELLSARPTSSLAEAELMRAYSFGPAPVTRTVPCACGGYLSATSGDERAIATTVAVHNESTVHQLWRDVEGDA